MIPVSDLDFEKGEIILVDKPLGWTSTDVVRKLRNLTGAKTGHGGTLDPLATGLLLIATGKATKQLNDLQNLPKEYEGTLYLGATTPSFDRETDIEYHDRNVQVSDEQIHEAAKAFIGDIEQLPPAFSAIKVDGVPAYKRAHKGKLLEMRPRPVTIYDLKITGVQLPLVHFYVHCSKGTYIRSLAKDLGEKLGTGAFLHDLRRISIGNHHVDNAWKLDELVEKLKDRKTGKEV